MIYPIRAYGDPVLRAKCEEIVSFDEDLNDLIQSMYKTMDASDGVGLAAPQIGKALRMFMIDSTGVLRYKGAIDDIGRGMQFFDASFLQANNYVSSQIPELIAQQALSIDSTAAYGCSVKYNYN